MENKKLTLVQLAEAHLMNVQREIAGLNEQKSRIEGEIKRLTEYLNDGVDAIRQAVQVKADPVEVFKGE